LFVKYFSNSFVYIYHDRNVYRAGGHNFVVSPFEFFLYIEAVFQIDLSVEPFFMINDLLRTKWISEGVVFALPASYNEIMSFQNENNVVLPIDLVKYFQEINGSGGDLTNTLFEFYSLAQIRTINKELENWKGIPSYKNLSNVVSDIDQLYVFGNYLFNLYVYAIRLYPTSHANNEVYVFCGEDHKVIGNSFSEFLAMYLEDSEEIRI